MEHILAGYIRQMWENRDWLYEGQHGFSVVKCSEVLQCSDGTSNKVSNSIRRHIENREFLLICILLLSHCLIFFRFIF
jgi:hypothetical protein